MATRGLRRDPVKERFWVSARLHHEGRLAIAGPA
jgi:hypothetical protein